MAETFDRDDFRDMESLSNKILNNIKEVKNLNNQAFYTYRDHQDIISIINSALKHNIDLQNKYVKLTDNLNKRKNKELELVNKIRDSYRKINDQLDISKRNLEKVANLKASEKDGLIEIQNLENQILIINREQKDLNKLKNKINREEIKVYKEVLDNLSAHVDIQKIYQEDLEDELSSLKLALDIQLKSKKIDEDKVKDLETNIKLTQKNLKTTERNIENLSKSQKITENILKLKEEEHRNLKDAIKDNKELAAQIQVQVDRAKNLVSNYNKLKGMDNILGRLSKLPLIGQFINADKAMDSLRKKATEGSLGIKDMMGALRIGLEDLGKVVLWIAAIELVVKLVKAIISSAFLLDKQVTQIAKSFTITKDQARILRRELAFTAANASKLAIVADGFLATTEDILKTQLDFNESLGVSVKLTADQLAQLTASRVALGLSEEALMNLTKTSISYNQEIQDVESNILGSSIAIQAQNGLALNNKQILEKTLKITGSIRGNFKGNIQLIAEAITKAKLLGTTLEKINDTAGSLLDFESSIESELESELLTGKELNLERARYYALTNNMVGLMEELNKQNINFSNYTNLNRVAQESLAKTFGFTRDEFSDMLFEQQTLSKLREQYGRLEKNNLLEEYKLLKAQGKTREDLTKIIGEQALMNLEQQDAQEKFNKALEAAKEGFANLVDSLGGTKGIEWVANSLVNLIKQLQILTASLSKNGFFSTFFGSGISKETYIQNKSRVEDLSKEIIDLRAQLREAEKNQDKNAIESLKSQLSSKFETRKNLITPEYVEGAQEVEDTLIRPGKSPIKFNKDDIIVAGTNVMGEKGSKNDKIDLLISKIDELIKATNSKEITINNQLNIDSNKLFNEASKHVVRT